MHLFGFIIRIFHDARSPERQIRLLYYYHDVKSWAEPVYNDIGLCHTPSITSDILLYQFLTVTRNIVLHSFVTHTKYPVPFMML